MARRRSITIFTAILKRENSFADTFYWAALTSPDDSFYGKALDFSRLPLPARIVTSDDVLIEYLAFFAKAGPSVRSQAGHLASRLLHDSRVLVVPQSRELFLGALDLYKARPDKGYSLTDARCSAIPEPK
jgi:hypothetical protein